jgi:tetratricopeptide (TPR) repeat protein
MICRSQDPYIDSLKRELKAAKLDRDRCTILNQLVEAISDGSVWPVYNQQMEDICTAQLKKTSPDDSSSIFFKKYLAAAYNNKGLLYSETGKGKPAIEYYDKSLKMREAIGDKKGLAETYINLGLVYDNRGDMQNALFYFEKGLKASEEVNDPQQVSTALNNIGIVYHNLGDIPKALEYYMKSLQMQDKLGDKLKMAATLNNMAVLYNEQKDEQKSFEFYQKSLRLREEINDKMGIAESLNNIGLIYKERGDAKKALECFTRSYQLHEEMGDLSGMAYSLSNTGLIYNDSAAFKNAVHLFPKALDYHKRSLKIREEIGDKKGMAASYHFLATTMAQWSKPAEGIPYGEKSLELAQETGIVSAISDASNILSKLYGHTGNWKMAYRMHVLYKNMADSLSNESNRKAAMQKGFQYEYEKKAAADSLEVAGERKVFGERMQKEKTQRTALYIGIALIAIFSAFMYNRFRITRKQKQLIEIKEKETQEQKLEIEEKHREISDSINYAERIQRSFMASKDLLDKNLPEYFVLFRPRDVVSGDFYWCAELANGNFVLATADSTGHGVPGAIMSLLNITSLEKAIEQHSQPDRILDHARTIIIDRLKKDGSEEGGKDGMDCSLLAFDFAAMKLRIAAANNPVWIVRNSELTEIKPDKMPVGKHDRQHESFTLHTVDLNKGDVIYTLTDGFPDQFGGPKGKKFMSKNLKELLLANHSLPLQEQKDLLEKAFHDWVGTLEQIDDVTVTGIRI